MSTLKKFMSFVWDKISPLLKYLSKLLKRYLHRYQIIRWIIVIILAFIFLGSAYLTFEAKTADVSGLEKRLSHPTAIYDHNGHKAEYLYSKKSSWTKLKNISPNIQNAVVATEDHNFYKEHGFSANGIGRAMLLYAFNRLIGRHTIAGGGSTLTQQLVKNAFLTQQQTFTRKIKELFLSIEVENVYSKKSILDMYLNNAYFGKGVWGIGDASEYYFNKKASELTVPEAATLAGMLTNPTIYNPMDHPDWAKERRNLVLKLMVDNNKIPAESKEGYQNTRLIVSHSNNYGQSRYKYSYYLDSVIREANNRYGLDEQKLLNHGYKIYTYLDQSKQKGMEKTLNNSMYFPYSGKQKLQASSVAVNPKTGGVEAVVGGRGQHSYLSLNRATQMQRQPGSALKPLAVYVPALEAGYKINSMLQDKHQSYGNNHYAPSNHDNIYSGKVPMYQALEESKNAAAVWLLNKIGINQGYNACKRFGLNVNDNDRNLSLGLGNLNVGVSPIQMARAYTTFANDGNMVQTNFIRKIVDSSGNVIVDNSPQLKPVISSSTAKKMTSMMLGVFNDYNGTGYGSEPYGYKIAGKTGTTQVDASSDSDVVRDKWIVGYTPNLVVTTWEGFDDSSKNSNQDNVIGVGINNLFKSELANVLPYSSNQHFDVKPASESSKYGDQQFFNNNNNNQFERNLNQGFNSFKQQIQVWGNGLKKFITGR